MDLFDIAENSFNPRSGIDGMFDTAGVYSLVDFTPYRSDQQLNYLGNGKSLGRVGLNFSYGAFSGSTNYIFGSSSTAATRFNIPTE